MYVLKKYLLLNSMAFEQMIVDVRVALCISATTRSIESSPADDSPQSMVIEIEAQTCTFRVFLAHHFTIRAYLESD
jgi:hypothetical protein